MAATKKQAQPYGLAPTFERCLVYLACSHPPTFGRVGAELEHDALGTPAARLAIEAAQAIARDTGHGPDSPALVVQRLCRWREQGRVTHEQITEVNALLDAAEDDPHAPDAAAVVAEVVPILQRRALQRASLMATDVYANRGDPAQVVQLYHRVAAMGAADVSEGVVLGEGAFEEIARIRSMHRLETGIPELDHALGGGPPRGSLSVWIGRPKSGKSMALCQQAAHGLLLGMHVALATLEVPPAVEFARVMSNLSGIPIDTILEGAEAQVKRALEQYTGLGRLVVKSFPARATTCQHLWDWLELCEERAGRAVELLIVDYADRMGVPGKDGTNGTYQPMGIIYDDLRNYAVEHSMWTWTASQPKGGAGRGARGKGKSYIGLDDVADSQHKVRIADLILTLNEDEDQMEFLVAGNRNGKSGVKVGPLPADFTCALIAPVARTRAPF